MALIGVAAAAPDGVLLRSLQKGGEPLLLLAVVGRAGRALSVACVACAGLPNIVIFCWKFVFCAAVQFLFVLYGRGGPPTPLFGKIKVCK